MSLVEELPTTAPLKVSHGWAYVPDTGPITAAQPGSRSDRKRTAAAATTTAAQVNHRSKQEKAIQARLDALNRENPKDGVHVPIPLRTGGISERDKGRKMTSNVKRILTYQRGFQHYLAEDLAAPDQKHYILPTLGTGGMGPPVVKESENLGKQSRRDSKVSSRRSTTNRQSIGNATNTPEASQAQKHTPSTKRKRPSSRSQSISTTNPPPSTAPSSTAQLQDEEHDKDNPSVEQDTVMLDTTQPPPPTTYPPEYDHDPLLRTLPSEVPLPPSDRVIQLLLAEPPLTWTASRATPLAADKTPPARHFCGVCGYWGRVKCRKCGDWTCGILDCWKGHAGVCVMANAY